MLYVILLCAHWTLWCTCSVLLYYHSVCPRVHCHHHATRDVILQMSHLGVMDLVVIFRLRGTQDGGADGQTGLRLHPIPRALLCRDCGG